jgi:hypothetical protein
MQELVDALGIDQRVVQLLELSSGFCHHSRTHPSLAISSSPTHGEQAKRLA